MQHEIDTALEAEVARRAAAPGTRADVADDRSRVARLASRLYVGASAVQRSRIVTGLLRPLGPLALVAVASGAFAGVLTHVSGRGGGLTVDDLASFTNGQIFELARFVEQVSPDTLHQVAGAIAENPFGVSAFGAAAAVLLVNALRGNARQLPPI